MMPRGGSLSVGCTPDHCSPSCLGDVEKLSVCLFFFFFFFLMTYDRDLNKSVYFFLFGNIPA